MAALFKSRRVALMMKSLATTIPSMLQSAVTLSLLAGVAITSAVNNNKLTNKLLSMYQHLYEK